MSNKHMIVWPDGEYVFSDQYKEEPHDGLGYTKSDDYRKVMLEHGFNNVDLGDGNILVVELDYWGNVWERHMFSKEPWLDMNLK